MDYTTRPSRKVKKNILEVEMDCTTRPPSPTKGKHKELAMIQKVEMDYTTRPSPKGYTTRPSPKGKHKEHPMNQKVERPNTEGCGMPSPEGKNKELAMNKKVERPIREDCGMPHLYKTSWKLTNQVGYEDGTTYQGCEANTNRDVASVFGPVAVEKRGKKKNEGAERKAERHHMPKPFVDLPFHEEIDSNHKAMCSKVGAIYRKARGEALQADQECEANIDRDVAPDLGPLDVEERGNKKNKEAERN